MQLIYVVIYSTIVYLVNWKNLLIINLNNTCLKTEKSNIVGLNYTGIGSYFYLFLYKLI